MHVPTSPSTVSTASLSMNNTSTPGTTPPSDNAALTLADVLSAPFKVATTARVPVGASVSPKKRGPLPVPPVLPLSGTTSSYEIDPQTGLPVGFVPSIPNQPAHVTSTTSQHRGVCSPSDEVSALRRLQVLSRVAANTGKKNECSGSYPSPAMISRRISCGPAALGSPLPPRPSTRSSFSSYERTPEQKGLKLLTRIDLLERVAAIADRSPRTASPALSMASNSTISHNTASTHECLCATCKRGVELRQQSFRPMTRSETQCPPPDQIAVIQQELKDLNRLVSTTFASLPFDVAEMLSSVHCLRDDLTALRSEFSSVHSASPSSCPPSMPMPMPNIKPLQTPPVCPMPSLWNVSDSIGSGTITPEPPYTPVIPPPPSFDGYIPIQPPLPPSHFSRTTSRATSPPLPSSRATPISSHRTPWVLPPIEPISPPCMPTTQLASMGMNNPEVVETVPRGFVPLSDHPESGHGPSISSIPQPCFPSLGPLPPSLAPPSLALPQVARLQPYPGCTLVPTSTTHAHTRFSLSSPDINEDCSPALSLSQHPLISCPPGHAPMPWSQVTWPADVAAFMESMQPPPPMPTDWCHPMPVPVPQYSPPAPSTATATTTTSAGASAARVVPTAWVAPPTPDSTTSTVSWIHDRQRRLSTITEKTETSPPVAMPQLAGTSDRTPKSSYGAPRQTTATLRPVIPTWVPPLPMPSPSNAGSPVSTASSMFGPRIIPASPSQSSRPTRHERRARSPSRSVSRSPSVDRSERSRRRSRRDREDEKVYRIEVNPTIIVCGGAQAGQQCNHLVQKKSERSRSRSRSRSLRRDRDVRRSRSPSPESYRGRSRSRTPLASYPLRSQAYYRGLPTIQQGSQYRRGCVNISPSRSTREGSTRHRDGLLDACIVETRASTPYAFRSPRSQPSLLATPQSSPQTSCHYRSRPYDSPRTPSTNVSPMPSVSALTMEGCGGTSTASPSPSVSTASVQMPSPLSCPSLLSPHMSGQSSPVPYPYPYTTWTNTSSPHVAPIPVVVRSEMPSEEGVRQVQETPKDSVMTWLAMDGMKHGKYEMSSAGDGRDPSDWRGMPQELYNDQSASGSRAIPAQAYYSTAPQEPLSRRAGKAPSGPRRVVHGQAYPWGPLQASTTIPSEPEPLPVPVPEPAVAPLAPASELTVIPNPFAGSIFSSSASSNRSDSRCASEALAVSQTGSICDYDVRPSTRPSPTSQHYIPLVCSPEPLPHPHLHSRHPAPSMSRPVSQRPMYSYGPLVMTPEAMSPETLPYPPSSLSSPLAPMPTSTLNILSPPAPVSTPPMPKTPSPGVDQPQSYTPGSNSSVLDLLERLPAPVRLPPVSSLMSAVAPRPALISGQSILNRWHSPVRAPAQRTSHELSDVLPPVNLLFQYDNDAVMPVISTRKNPLFEWLGPDHSPASIAGPSSSTLQTDSIPNITLPSLLDLLKDTSI